MYYWTTYPFLRIIGVFVAGILTAKYTIIPSELEYFHLLIGFALLLFLKSSMRRIGNMVWGNLLLLIIFLTGFAHWQQIHKLSDRKVEADWENCQAYFGTVSSFPADKGKYVTYELTTKAIIRDSLADIQHTRILIYQRKHPDSTSAAIKYGDQLIIEGAPGIIPAARNPFVFDFAAYMAEKNIFAQDFINSDQVSVWSSSQTNTLSGIIYSWRTKLNQLITANIDDPRNQSIIRALLLGIKGSLDRSTKTSFAAAGAMHVLAVSGLHVSVVSMLITSFFNLFPDIRIRKWFSPWISLVALWTYALLTGFSPSIIRAVTMFSLIILSSILNRRTNAINSLAFAAFVLLIFDCKYLFNVGFQLSFLAVAGILLLYPPLCSLWKPKTWLGEKIWQLTCVSLAAQVATFPVTMYYFHQFPTYFLLSNLIVIPAAFLIMVLGICLMLFHQWIPWIAAILETISKQLNHFVSMIEQLDGSVINQLSPTMAQVLLLYICIISIFGLVHARKYYFLYLLLFSSLGISAIQLIRVHQQSNQSGILFYSLKNDLIMDKVTGIEAQLMVVDSTVNLDRHVYQISPFRTQQLLNLPDSLQLIDTQLSTGVKLAVIHGIKVIFISSAFDPTSIAKPINADLVVISNQSIDAIESLARTIYFDQIILDGSNRKSYVDQLKMEAKALNVRLIALRDNHYYKCLRD